ncbi:MAG: tRNA (adenosine(37)-N6)-dimethylallyltransferase MiaA [bacterium]
MNDLSPSLVVVTGPTAIGKTRVAIELAKKLSAEIISCDSRQFYRELAIGVARPTAEELAVIPHHLIGFLSVHDPYNVYRFEADVMKLTEKLFSRSNFVILAGGSGLFIHAVTHGIDDLPDPDPGLRGQLNKKLESEGVERLQDQLRELDPDYFRIVDKHNPKRLLRALEVCLTTGRPYSSFRKSRPRIRPFRTVKIGLNTDRQKLYTKINLRVDQMIASGLFEEARSLYPFRHLNALNTVGYKELFDFMDGKTDFPTAVEKIKTNTRRYAKRQLTWFNRDKEITWFEPENLDEIVNYVKWYSINP